MKQKTKIISFSVSFLVLFFLMIFYLIFPTIGEIKKISKEISQNRLRLEIIIKQQEEIERFKKIFPEIKNNLLILENSFVNKEIPIDFIEFLEKIANDLKIKSEISILSSLKDSLSFQVRGVGVVDNVFKFIEKLESANYLIQIENVKISRVGNLRFNQEELKASKNNLWFEVTFLVLTK
jgi:hypothetical protein